MRCLLTRSWDYHAKDLEIGDRCWVLESTLRTLNCLQSCLCSTSSTMVAAVLDRSLTLIFHITRCSLPVALCTCTAIRTVYSISMYIDLKTCIYSNTVYNWAELVEPIPSAGEDDLVLMIVL